MSSFTIPVNITSMHDIILWAEDELKKNDVYFGHGTNNALDEAAYLISYCAQKPINFTDEDLAYSLTTTQRTKVAVVLQQRIEEKLPSAYITNKAYFFGLEFEVNENVLVPRSPIAELIAEEFFPWLDINSHKKKHESLNILDMCTGSGCIAIACATVFDDVDIVTSVDAVDISAEALEVANRNIKKHKMDGRVNAIQSNMFNNVPLKKYDIIVSNPPYVTQEEIDDLPAEYHQEPSLGLFAAESGLEFAITILKKAKDYLSDEGIVVIEVGNSAETLQNYYPKIPFTWIEFEMGGEGVFVLDAQQINQYHSQF